MIQSFQHKGLKRFYEKDGPSKLPPDMVERIRGILTLLDNAKTVEQIDRPSLRLHPLKGGLKGFYAVTVRANWRIVFIFKDGHAFDVNFLDYH